MNKIKNIDNIGLMLCDYQADLFEKSINYFDCSSIYFVKVFMNSKLAERIDNPSFVFESTDIVALFSDLKNQHKLNRGKELYPTYVMRWIGYIYRFFSYTYNYSSKKVYGIIKPKELYFLYEAYHSLDPKEVIERIIESKNINTNIDLIELAKKYYL